MITRNNDQGPRPAQPSGDGPSNGSTSRAGNGKRHADQGDLWSDAPSAPPAPVEPQPGPAGEPAAVTPAATPAPARRNDNAPATRASTASRARTPVEDAAVAESTETRGARQATRTAPVTTTRPAARRIETAPAPPAPIPPTLEEPQYDYADGDDEVYFEEPASMLRNPYVLAGLAVSVAIVLAVMVVFVFGKGGDTPGAIADSGASGAGAAVANPTAQSTVPAVAGLQVKSLTTATVHSGPGLDFLDVGLLRSNQDVQVVGRNEDATFYEIIFPPGSNFGGWVVASSLKLPSDAASKVAVVKPTPIPQASVPPTSTPVPATPTPVGKADIALHLPSSCAANQKIDATIDNVGEVPLENVSLRIVVTQSGNTLYDATYKIESLQPGQSVKPDIQTNAQAPSVTVTATLSGVTDVNSGNDSATCTVGGPSNNNGNNSVPPPVSTKSTGATATPRNSNNDR